LECTQDPKLVQLALDATVDIENNLVEFERTRLVQMMAMDNFVGYKAVIELVEKHHEIINEK
jgi:hypothetical protein